MRYVVVIVSLLCVSLQIRCSNSSHHGSNNNGSLPFSGGNQNNNAGSGNNNLGSIFSSNACVANKNQIGQACVTQNGNSGTLGCYYDKIICQLCTPGATQALSCSCGLNANAICSDDGLSWLNDVCNTCNMTNKCNQRDACIPNEIMYQTCDGSNQGGACIATKFVCGTDCAFHQDGHACVPYAPQCTLDDPPQPMNQCGLCGTQTVTCDGCFLKLGPCSNQGICSPGSTVSTPCSANDTKNGVCENGGSLATQTCSSTCQWGPATTCASNCALKATQTIQLPCTNFGSQYGCGNANQLQTCTAQLVTSSCGDGSGGFYENVWVNTSNDAAQSCSTAACPPTPSTLPVCGDAANQCNKAGQTRSVACTTTCGGSTFNGLATETCNTATGCFSAPGQCLPPSNSTSTWCIPNTTINLGTCPCGGEHLDVCDSTCGWQDIPCANICG